MQKYGVYCFKLQKLLFSESILVELHKCFRFSVKLGNGQGTLVSSQANYENPKGCIRYVFSLFLSLKKSTFETRKIVFHFHNVIKWLSLK